MREKRPHGLGSLGDVLSVEAKEKLAKLKEELQKKVSSAVTGKQQHHSSQKKSERLPRWKPKPERPRIKPGASALSKDTVAKKGVARTKTARRSDYTPEPDNFSYWTLPPEASARQSPPSEASQVDIDTFSDIIAADIDDLELSQGNPLYGVIGLDFGTSATKVIIRFPYEPDAPAFVIPAPPHCRSEGNPYLWQTVVWLRKNGDFIAWPEPGAELLYSLKQGLMSDRAWTAIDTAPHVNLKRVDAATGFLYFVIRYARGWLRREQIALFKDRPTTWFLNVGLPVENYDDEALVSTYRNLAVAALRASSFPSPISANTVQQLLEEEKIGTSASAEGALALGVTIVPETVAEAAGFMMSNQSADGVYAMVDVGAMTLDICAFRYWKPSPSDRSHSLYAASVKPLGVEALHWFLDHGKTIDGFREQCDRSLWGLLLHTRHDRARHAECWEKGRRLPVFLVGGGAENEVHRERLVALNDWLQEYIHNSGLHLLKLPKPSSIDLPESMTDFGRLAVAWGLSYEASEIGKFKLPSQIKDLPPEDHADLSNYYVGKEQV